MRLNATKFELQKPDAHSPDFRLENWRLETVTSRQATQTLDFRSFQEFSGVNFHPQGASNHAGAHDSVVPRPGPAPTGTTESCAPARSWTRPIFNSHSVIPSPKLASAPGICYK